MNEMTLMVLHVFIILCLVVVMIKGVHDEKNVECTKPIRECLRKKYHLIA